MYSFVSQIAMNCLRYIGTLAMGLFSWMIGPNAAVAATRQPAPLPPISYQTFKRPHAQPGLLKRHLTPPELLAKAVLLSPGPSPWHPLAHQPPFNAGAMLLLTDGTVMVQDQGAKNTGSSDWWRLTPDVNGSYLNGQWSKLASLPAGYSPLYFASAVLPDGRVIIEGGQYNNGQEVFTNLGAIYNPLANEWTPVPPPSGRTWSLIGSAAGTVLANGTFMIGGVVTTQQALFNPANLSWTITGSGKADVNSEEGWTLLPNGDVLTVDCNHPKYLTNSERFRPILGSWVSAGSTIVKLDDTNADNSGSHEMGPQVLRPDGTVFAAGATGHTAVYSSVTGTWKAATDFPVANGPQYDVADGPAALLPSGKVLVAASPGVIPRTPTHLFVFDGAKLQQVADTPNAASLSSYFGFMIVLPTGQVMFNSRFGDIELFTETGGIAPNIAPIITQVPTLLVAGKSYVLSGKQLNGVSQGAAYNEGYQSATNYPLVRIVNAATQHVFYARTFGHSGMSVTPGAVSSTNFTVPTGIETGAATLFAVANGIASAPVSVTVAK
jgi:hypothetical protein